MTLAQFQKLNPGLVEWGSGNWKVLFPGQIVNVSGVVTGVPAEPSRKLRHQLRRTAAVDADRHHGAGRAGVVQR
jgi:hypothetical protein